MKKVLICTLLCIFLFVTGCGKQVSPADISSNNKELDASFDEMEVENSIEQSLESPPEEESSEEIIEIDESEIKYQELLAKYENTPYKNPVKLEYIPRVGENFDFSFCDTITNVEDIGGYQDIPEGYFLIHYNNNANDVLVSDAKHLSENIFANGHFSELTNLLFELKISLNQKGAVYNSSGDFGLDFTEGDEIEHYKPSVITNVVDTGIIYDGMKYYEIENGYGLKNLIGVYEVSLPSEDYPLYNLGYFEDGIYHNPDYNIKVSCVEPDTYESYAKTSVFFGEVCFHETIYEKDSACVVDFYTYEFKNESEAKTYDILEGRPNYTLLDTEEIIAGKTYQRAEAEEVFVNRNTTSVLLWRCEGNKVYCISKSYMQDKNEILSLLSPFSEE